MPESLHRGPRFVQAAVLPDTAASRVLMPELLGRVLYLARRGVDGSQAQVAEISALPPSTVSKLEIGAVSTAVHHLDALADAFSQIAGRARIAEPVRWGGWELHHVATVIAESLTAAGYACIWERSDLVPESDARYVRGRDLTALTRRHWPDSFRSRL